MTAKFKQIIAQLSALLTFKANKSISDEDFIANIACPSTRHPASKRWSCFLPLTASS